MRSFSYIIVATAILCVSAQQKGTQKTNVNLPMTTQTCTASGCTDNSNKVTLDGNWRWTHKVGTSTNCYTGNSWDKTICPDPETCTQNCALDGVPESDWVAPYGITADGTGLELKFVTKGQYSTNVGSRTYLLEGEDKYKMFKLKNREFTFDVDVSNMPCGLNGALYFVEMAEDGGMSTQPNNKAGAAYGTGYCDAQCPHDIKFIGGEANSGNWTPSATDKNAGTGHYGSCCHEMDIWESNKMASAYTPHVCTVDGPHRCEGQECGDNDAGDRFKGVCDKNGCDFNSYRMGDKTFFGEGSSFAVDTSKPFTVVTQFITEDGTDTGDLSEIRRVYVQDGVVIPLRNATLSGLEKFDSITDDYCSAQTSLFGDPPQFIKNGGMKKMGEALERGMVLVMSMWDDHSVNMLWLDSDYPTDQPSTKPGVARGPCSTSSGKPDDVESQYPNSSVKYSNIKTGTIGSTFSGSPSSPTPAPAPSSPTPSPSGCPGGDLSACIALCPSSPAAAYKACVNSCVSRCS